MKKVVLSLGLLIVAAAPSVAQDKKNAQKPAKSAVEALHVDKAPAATGNNLDAMKFQSDTHDFGTIPEGPSAEYEFVFTNVGKEPIVIQQARPSCGCTTPSWSKDPVLPGKTGSVKAVYSTKGRPNAFTKTISVVTNLGTKVLTIKGNVEKAPESSVPANTSMIKTH